MNAFLALLRKDLSQYLANRRAVLMSLVAPILIAAFFGSLFGGKETRVSRVPVAVTDLDGSELSKKIVAALAADPALDLKPLPEAQAAAEVRAGRLRAALTLPAGFGAQAVRGLFGAGTKPEVVLVVDPSQSMVLPLVKGLLSQHAMQAVGSAALPPGAGAAALGGGAPGFSPPFNLREVQAVAHGPGTGYDGYAHSFAGMGVQFILLFGVDIGITLLTLRRTGLWLRLRAAPISRAQLLGSRMASCALIAAGVFTVLWLVAVLAFGVRVRGSVLGLALVVAAFSLLTASFGLMIAALGRTPEFTRGLAILATLLLVMLGGAWVPSFLFPPWVQAVAAWVPTHWAVDGLDAMTWRGLPLSASLLPTAVLLLFAAGFAAIALMRFRWEE